MMNLLAVILLFGAVQSLKVIERCACDATVPEIIQSKNKNSSMLELHY